MISKIELADLPRLRRLVLLESRQMGNRGLLMAAAILAALSAQGCTTTKLPPSAPEAIKVLVPVVKPCVPATVEATKKPIDDPAFLELPFVETIKGLVVSVLQSDQENLKLRAANDRPCGDK